MAMRARSVSSRRAVSGSAAFTALAGLVVLALSFAPPATAANINYGSFPGTHVQFSNVNETTDDSVPLFGPPTASGNSLDFNPLAFSAFSEGGGNDVTSADLAFGVAANSGSVIDGITLSEVGNVTLAGIGPRLSDTVATVVASGVLRIHEVDSADITDVVVPFALTFSPSGGTYSLVSDGGGLPIFFTNWTGSVALDVDAILTANGVAFDHGATELSVELTNTLSAESQTGTSALINKNDVSVIITTADGPSNVVPEPGTLTLIGAGLIALMLRRRRPWSA